MAVQCEYKPYCQRWYESTTGETLHVAAEHFMKDHFDGAAELARWAVVGTNYNTTPTTADAENGVFSIAMDADNNAENGVLYYGDKRVYDVKNEIIIFEARVSISVTPTDVAEGAWGMAGDTNAALDTITEGAWFKVDGSTAIVTESDDTTNNNDDTSTGETTSTSAYNIYRIDFSDISNVKFYIDGERVSSGTTFDMSNLTDAEGLMQPYFAMNKASGTGVGTMLIDYVAVWGTRS